MASLRSRRLSVRNEAFNCGSDRLRCRDAVSAVIRNEVDGKQTFLSPERSMAIQMKLGSDIAMVLDECPPFTEDEGVVARAVNRTTAWARRAREARQAIDSKNAQFGIVQATTFEAHEAASFRAQEDMESLGGKLLAGG